MQRNTIDLLFPVIGAILIAKTFIDGNPTTNLFGVEISVWLYRFIWLVMIGVGLYRYFNPNPRGNQ